MRAKTLLHCELALVMCMAALAPAARAQTVSLGFVTKLGEDVCYALGEYQSVTAANGSVYTAWGDIRNLLTEPVNALDPISGQTHSEEDVFFQKMKVQ